MKDILTENLSQSIIEATSEVISKTKIAPTELVESSSLERTLEYMNENGKNFGTHDHSDFKALIQEKVDPVAAREFLNQHGIRGKSYFSLNSDLVNKVVEHGEKSGYRKNRYAPGSFGRMYFDHLNKLADRADAMKAETAKKYNIKEEMEKEVTMDTPYKGVTSNLLETVKNVMTKKQDIVEDNSDEELVEGQGSYGRVEPMRKKQKFNDDWKRSAKKPRRDFDRTKRTVKEPTDMDEETETVHEAQGSFSRVEPMRRKERYIDLMKRSAKKPRRDFDRTKRTIKDDGRDLDEEALHELSDETLRSYSKKASEVLNNLKSKRGRKSAADIRTKVKREAGLDKSIEIRSARYQKAADELMSAHTDMFNNAVEKVLRDRGFKHVHATSKSALYMHHSPEENTITTVKHIFGGPGALDVPKLLIADSGRSTGSMNMTTPWVSHMNNPDKLPKHEEEITNFLKNHMASSHKSWQGRGVYESYEGEDY